MAMTLKEFLNYDKDPITTIFLWFDEQSELQFETKITKEIRDMEVMEVIYNNGEREIWLR